MKEICALRTDSSQIVQPSNRSNVRWDSRVFLQDLPREPPQDSSGRWVSIAEWIISTLSLFESYGPIRGTSYFAVWTYHMLMMLRRAHTQAALCRKCKHCFELSQKISRQERGQLAEQIQEICISRIRFPWMYSISSEIGVGKGVASLLLSLVNNRQHWVKRPSPTFVVSDFDHRRRAHFTFPSLYLHSRRAFVCWLSCCSR